MHACIAYWMNSWPPTENAWQPIPTCLFKKSDIRVFECKFLHSSSIVVSNKLTKCALKTLLASTPCSYKSHMITLVSLLNFNFQFHMPSFMDCKAFTTIKMGASATTMLARDSKHHNKYHHTRPVTGSQIFVWRYDLHYELLCWYFSSHPEVWYKNEKTIGLWSDWHYTTRGLVYG